MKFVPERLKNSRRLQLEIAAGGLALWYLKNKAYPEYRGPTETMDILPPAAESINQGFVTAEPGEFDETGKPRTVLVQSRLKTGYLLLRAHIDEAQNFIIEQTPETKDELVELKKGLNLARKKIKKRLAHKKRR
jgi:hypothetical protein